MATINTLNNGVTGLSFRQTLNDNFSNLNDSKVELSAVNSLDTRLTTAESEINSLDTATTALDLSLSSLETDVETLQGFHSFNYEAISNRNVVGDTYEDIINATYANLAAGTYTLTLSMVFSLNNTNTSSFFRFSTDGGSNWLEIRKEVKDITDLEVVSYTKPVVHAGGNFTLIVQSKKENAADVLNISEMSSIFERKQ